jgi:phenylalanyl-tRNA synthetase alpha chain
LDVHYGGKWMEILGCGLIHPTIMRSIPNFPSDTIGWAFGLGELAALRLLFSTSQLRF